MSPQWLQIPGSQFGTDQTLRAPRLGLCNENPHFPNPSISVSSAVQNLRPLCFTLRSSQSEGWALHPNAAKPAIPSSPSPAQPLSNNFKLETLNLKLAPPTATNLQDCRIRHTKTPFVPVKSLLLGMTILDPSHLIARMTILDLQPPPLLHFFPFIAPTQAPSSSGAAAIGSAAFTAFQVLKAKSAMYSK